KKTGLGQKSHPLLYFRTYIVRTCSKKQKRPPLPVKCSINFIDHPLFRSSDSLLNAFCLTSVFFLFWFLFFHNNWTGFCDSQCMFILTAESFVKSTGGPTVCVHFGAPGTGIDHRFDRDDHSLFQAQSLVRFAVMRNLRWFMQCWSNPVSDEFPDNGKSFAF